MMVSGPRRDLLSWTAAFLYFSGMALLPYVVGIFRG